jgi:hypothetical protein
MVNGEIGSVDTAEKRENVSTEATSLEIENPSVWHLNISSIYHQQAVAEHWDLPNTESFQSIDVASACINSKRILACYLTYHLNSI